MQRKPVVTEVRTPTDTWSGLGFSKSMPAEAAKELRNISRRCYKPYLSTIGSQQNQVLTHQVIVQQTQQTCILMFDTKRCHRVFSLLPPQSWAAQSAKVSNGSNSENWRDRRGSASSSMPVPSSSCSSSYSSSPPSTFSASPSSIPTFSSSVNRSRDDRPCKSHPCASADRQQTTLKNFLVLSPRWGQQRLLGGVLRIQEGFILQSAQPVPSDYRRPAWAAQPTWPH